MARGMRRLGVFFIGLGMFAALALGLGGCGSKTESKTQKRELQVFAAAVLTEAFTEIEQIFEQRHPGVDVKISFAATSILRLQVEQGARPPVFESADEKNIRTLEQGGYIIGKPSTLAYNKLTLIVPAPNAAKINSLGDLARPGVALVGCSPEVPIGAYTLQMLEKVEKSGNHGPDYAKLVKANFRSLEPNVKGIATKIMLGEADAGICYVSDINPEVAKRVKVIPIPDEQNVLAAHYIGLVKGAPNLDLGQEFVRLALSPEGQAVLARHGLIPVNAIGGPGP